MHYVLAPQKTGRDFELWKYGLLRLLGMVGGTKEDVDTPDAEVKVVHDLEGASACHDRAVFAFAARPLTAVAQHARVAADLQSAKLDSHEGVESLQASTAALCALSRPATYPKRFREMESRGKSGRCVVALRPFGSFREGTLNDRTLSYLDFLRWELAAFLDTLAPRNNIHIVGVTPKTNKDVVYDLYDFALRMSKNLAPVVHERSDLFEMLAIVSNATLLITDSRDVAAVGRACGAQTLLISDRFRHELPEADIYGPGLIEPFTLSLPTLQLRHEELQSVPAGEVSQAVQSHVSALLDLASRPCTLVLS